MIAMDGGKRVHRIAILVASATLVAVLSGLAVGQLGQGAVSSRCTVIMWSTLMVNPLSSGWPGAHVTQ